MLSSITHSSIVCVWDWWDVQTLLWAFHILWTCEKLCWVVWDSKRNMSKNLQRIPQAPLLPPFFNMVPCFGGYGGDGRFWWNTALTLMMMAACVSMVDMAVIRFNLYGFYSGTGNVYCPWLMLPFQMINCAQLNILPYSINDDVVFLLRVRPINQK